MENMERIIIIVTGSVLVLTTLYALLTAFLNTRSFKSAGEIVKARNDDVAWQNQTEAAIKELGLANERNAELWKQMLAIGVSAAVLVNREDASEFFKMLQSLGVKVLDGQPNTLEPTALGQKVPGVG